MNEWERLHQQAKRYQAEYPPGTRIMLLSMGRDPCPVEDQTRGTVKVPYLFLDLRPGGGNLLGPYWEVDSLSLGESWTLNTGESPRDVKESFLSQILEEHPPRKYYLSRKACLGILRRSAERGKKLPEKLKKALEIQVGIK